MLLFASGHNLATWFTNKHHDHSSFPFLSPCNISRLPTLLAVHVTDAEIKAIILD